MIFCGGSRLKRFYLPVAEVQRNFATAAVRRTWHRTLLQQCNTKQNFLPKLNKLGMANRDRVAHFQNWHGSWLQKKLSLTGCGAKKHIFLVTCNRWVHTRALWHWSQRGPASSGRLPRLRGMVESGHCEAQTANVQGERGTEQTITINR